MSDANLTRKLKAAKKRADEAKKRSADAHEAFVAAMREARTAGWSYQKIADAVDGAPSRSRITQLVEPDKYPTQTGKR